MAYTKITKASGTGYTNVNDISKEEYDQSSILYDDTVAFYDGDNLSLYTNVTKASGTSYTKIAKAV